ncbi:hypothetical protein Tco_0311392 [Tanacetum coccineum]
MKFTGDIIVSADVPRDHYRVVTMRSVIARSEPKELSRANTNMRTDIQHKHILDYRYTREVQWGRALSRSSAARQQRALLHVMENSQDSTATVDDGSFNGSSYLSLGRSHTDLEHTLFHYRRIEHDSYHRGRVAKPHTTWERRVGGDVLEAKRFGDEMRYLGNGEIWMMGRGWEWVIGFGGICDIGVWEEGDERGWGGTLRGSTEEEYNVGE